MSHVQASDETAGFPIWHLMCQQVANQSQSLDGSSTTMTTYSKRIAIFDVGSQAFPLTCAVYGVAIWHLVTASLLNGRGSKSCPNCFFYHYSTIPVPLYSIPTRLCCESPTRNKSEFCISMCECVFECTQVCISVQ